MPPKKKGGADASKKAVTKQKNKMLEDKTFGLKNKNKSKKVQQQIQSVTKSIMNSGDRKQRQLEEQRKAAKIEAKARKKAQEAEQNALFGEALLAIAKKNKHIDGKDGKQEAKGRDHGDDTNKKAGTSRAMKMMFQMDAQEMDDKLREDPNYIPTLEDEIELKRQKLVHDLKASGKKGTPITHETFTAWLEAKKKKKAEEARKLVEKELRKKKGGKGLSVLSGRALYEYKKSLFDNDDENADNDDDGNNDNDDEDVKDNDNLETTSSTNNNNNNQKGDTKTATNDDNDDDDDKAINGVVAKVQSDLFLEGDDDDLDDISEDEN